MKKYCIYLHRNKINNKIYIGQTCQKPEYRWNHGEGYKLSPRFYAAIKKYGWENFEHKILYTNLSLEQANILENKLIEQFDTTNINYGYNLDKGGNNKGTNEITKKKQSVSALLRPIVTESTKNKLSDIGKGRKRSEETKNKISQAAKIREQERKGRKERPVMCLNTLEIFSSCRKAADWCGLAGTSGISSVCRNGKQKTAGVHPITKEKLKWRYLTEEEENEIRNTKTK